MLRFTTTAAAANLTLLNCERTAAIHGFWWKCSNENCIKIQHESSSFTTKLRFECLVVFVNDDFCAGGSKQCM